MGLKEGLRRTLARFGAGLARLFGTADGEDAVEEIEDLLLGADAGVEATERIIANLRERLKRRELSDPERLHAHDTSFDPLDDESGALAPAQYLVDLRYEPEAAVAAAEDLARDREGVERNALAGLDGRSGEIVEKRWLAARAEIDPARAGGPVRRVGGCQAYMLGARGARTAIGEGRRTPRPVSVKQNEHLPACDHAHFLPNSR